MIFTPRTIYFIYLLLCQESWKQFLFRSVFGFQVHSIPPFFLENVISKGPESRLITDPMCALWCMHLVFRNFSENQKHAQSAHWVTYEPGSGSLEIHFFGPKLKKKSEWIPKTDGNKIGFQNPWEGPCDGTPRKILWNSFFNTNFIWWVWLEMTYIWENGNWDISMEVSLSPL